MSHSQQTPVKVPASAAAYTPATLDPDLRSQINMLLIREGYMTKIQDHLLHSLNAHPSNWPSAVQTHALALLRSGDVTTFPALVRRVLEDVRHETTVASSSTNGGGEANGTSATNGNGNSKSGANGTSSSGLTADGASLAIPQSVVDAVLKVTRECLEVVCEVDDGSAAG